MFNNLILIISQNRLCCNLNSCSIHHVSYLLNFPVLSYFAFTYYTIHHVIACLSNYYSPLLGPLSFCFMNSAWKFNLSRCFLSPLWGLRCSFIIATEEICRGWTALLSPFLLSQTLSVFFLTLSFYTLVGVFPIQFSTSFLPITLSLPLY